MFNNWFSDARTALAFSITLFSVLSITGTSIVYIVNATNKDEAAGRVLNSTLPLYGTWVGTLLAYYFAKENFDSAAENTIKLSQISLPTQSNTLESILVSAVISNRFYFEKDRNKDIRLVKQELTDAERRRLPILGQQDNLEFLAYYQDLDAYDTSNLGKKLNDFIRDLPDKNKPVVFIGKDITLAKANEERKKNPDCRDIFVTDNGNKDGKVIGYLTDFDIDKYSKT